MSHSSTWKTNVQSLFIQDFLYKPTYVTYVDRLSSAKIVILIVFYVPDLSLRTYLCLTYVSSYF